jgi:hypothetical protein
VSVYGSPEYVKELEGYLREETAEIERLREALEKIVTEPDAYTCRLIARQALEE